MICALGNRTYTTDNAVLPTLFNIKKLTSNVVIVSENCFKMKFNQLVRQFFFFSKR